MSYKRILFVGCSHGKYIDPIAKRAVLKFRDRFKPHTVVHLGDACDTAAFRSGAHGSSDESEPVEPDIEGGMQFLEELKVTHFLCGNHEARLWRMRESSNAVVAYAANKAVQHIEDTCRRIRARMFKYDAIWQGIQFGNFRAMHGVMYGENATRDHAEAFGNVVHAHTHRAAVAKGRRSDCPTAYCVGTLTRTRNMDYASTRRATLAWSQALVCGEYNDNIAHLCLHERQDNESDWRLP